MAEQSSYLSLTPVAQNIKPMPSMSMGEMVDLARGVQAYKQAEQLNPLALQQQQQTTQRGAIALSLDQAQERERNAIASYLSDPKRYMTPEGTVNLDELNARIPEIAPLTGVDWLKNYTDLNRAQTEASKASQNLTQDQRSIIASVLGAASKAGINDRESFQTLINDLPTQFKGDKRVASTVNAFNKVLDKYPNETNWQALAGLTANSLMTPVEQQQFFGARTNVVSTGGELTPVTTFTPITGGTPTAVAGKGIAPMTVSPESREEFKMINPITNQPMVQIKNARGEIIGYADVGGLPQTQQKTKPEQPAPARKPATFMRPGETQQTLAQANELRASAANQAQQAPMQTFNNNQIIKLADEALTGRGAGTLANLTGGYAVFNAVGLGGENATALNKLGHFMALQTSSLAQSSGLGGTDAARSIAGEISGTTQWTPDAIKSTARVNRALATSTGLFNQGIDNAIKRTGDPFAARDFQNQWSQTVDINAIRLYDAVKNKDAEGIRNLVTELGGTNSERYKNTRAKLDAMNRLLGTK